MFQFKSFLNLLLKYISEMGQISNLSILIPGSSERSQGSCFGTFRTQEPSEHNTGQVYEQTISEKAGNFKNVMRSLKTYGKKYLLSLYRYSNQDEHKEIKQLWNLISAKK